MGNLCTKRKNTPLAPSPSVQPEKLTIRIPKHRQTHSRSLKIKTTTKKNKRKLKKTNTR